ncbi:MAG: DNA primase [Clostridiales bacterium]|nr:DNA primase [Clostridiales bacterium]
MANVSLTPDFLEELRAKNDIVDVASKYLTLNRRGGNFWACCPFHNEKTPSFSIKQDGQFFKCFGCGESGNVINFIMKMENVDFMTAVEILCKNCGMQMPSHADSEEMQKRKHERDRVYQILRHTTEFYHQNLLKNPDSLQAKYLRSRQISDEMIDKFQIGASLNYDDLVKYLHHLGFTYDEMVMAGVVGKNEHGSYDFYGGRLLFPIMNGFGDVVAYSGRSVDDNPTHAKYKNTPQTVVFNKSEILFAYNFVRDLKKEHMLDTIIIVEGHIDVIACHQIGISNTIGCMGTALTPLHAKKIKQLVDNVILCLDGDNAGTMATYKAIDTLKQVGLNIKVVRLNRAKDPDEYIKKYGKEAFLEELYSGQDCVDFVLKDSATKYDLTSNNERTKYIQEALNYISKFSLPAEQEIYLSEVQKLVRVPIDALRKSLHSTEVSVVRPTQEMPASDDIRDNFIRESKIMLLSSMLYKKIKNFDEISGLFVSDDELSKLYEFLKQKIEDNKDYNVSTLFDNFEIKANSLIDRVINYVFPGDEVFSSYLHDTIQRVKIYELECERDKVKNQMLNSETDDEKYFYLNKLKDITDKINKEKK